ncbi:MAG: MoxR family ATPase [Candidatus Sumerlaeia bacterium]|nr:MoxR family ATPase [Candidatus Sumerlaeia bacterium]
MARKSENATVARLEANIASVIKGKSESIRMIIIGLLARGHILIEDVPGVGKTTLAQLLARSISCSFRRIQFTSDLLPSDILGVSIYDRDKKEFQFKPGPIFANVVVADEINRTTPKTQSALLEAMNVAQVSIDGITHTLPQPFLVIATQNPIEFHGTFPLPRSQMDRFLMRIRLGYPSPEHEVVILKEQKALGRVPHVEPVLTADEVVTMQEAVTQVKVDDDLLDYITRAAQATRQSPKIELGVSTRGALALRQSAQARAYVHGRDYVIPDDIKDMISPVWAHRIQVAQTFEGTGIGQHDDEVILQEVLSQVEVPL